MSELINKNECRGAVRWQLLGAASSVVLAYCATSIDAADAADTDRPAVWIELGGQLEMLQGTYSPFLSPFMNLSPTPDPYNGASPLKNQAPTRNALGLEGKITIQPHDSDWVFTAGIRYGRSNTNRHLHHQTNFPSTTKVFCYSSTCYNIYNQFYQEKFSDIRVMSREQHFVLDFSAGRDVGLGMLGRNGSSVVSGGVRYVQFSEKTDLNIIARPNVDIVLPTYFGVKGFENFYHYTMHGEAERSFHAIGPAVSWNASAAIAGNREDAELTFDWGVNASVLFGRQKAKTSHHTQTNHQFFTATFIQPHSHYVALTPVDNASTRSRSVVVPNVGGFAGFSVKYPNAKVSLGYRADFFFGATDTGIDSRDTATLGFHGPFAAVSIGLGG